MTRDLRAWLRDIRYALPGQIEKRISGPGPAEAVGICRKMSRAGMAGTIGYFQSASDRAEAIAAANMAVAAMLKDDAGTRVYLSVKAPPLGFDAALIRSLAEAADTAGSALLFDAHAPKDADRTLDIVSGLLPDFPGTGLAVPARWKRSLADVGRFRESGARVRLVKGEWADSESSGGDVDRQYLALIAALAGRSGPVSVATHDPSLAERALTVLREKGTPCELEQLRGLPRRRTIAVARRLGVPVRLYVPFGPGWWPYAVDKALARPYLPLWAVRDMIGI